MLAFAAATPLLAFALSGLAFRINTGAGGALALLSMRSRLPGANSSVALACHPLGGMNTSHSWRVLSDGRVPWKKSVEFEIVPAAGRFSGNVVDPVEEAQDGVREGVKGFSPDLSWPVRVGVPDPHSVLSRSCIAPRLGDRGIELGARCLGLVKCPGMAEPRFSLSVWWLQETVFL